MKHELQNIISGKSQVKYGANIQAIASYLRTSKSTSEMVEGSIQIKRQEENLIEEFSNRNYFWYQSIKVEKFVSNGAEQLSKQFYK